jgi:signal transduction histidine kinase
MIRPGITFKLFVFTAMMFALVLILFYFGQAFFFKQYYLNRKVEKVSANFEAFAKDYMEQKGDITSISRLEENFFSVNNTWVTILDPNGTISDREDNYIDVDVVGQKSGIPDSPSVIQKPLPPSSLPPPTKRIPLNNILVGRDTAFLHLAQGDTLDIDGIEHDNLLFPLKIIFPNRISSTWDNNPLQDALLKLGLKPRQKTYISGSVRNIVLSPGRSRNYANYNDLFNQSICRFQAELLMRPAVYDNRLIVRNEVNFGLTNKTFVKPLFVNSKLAGYAYGLIFLQPVNEVMDISKAYYYYAYIAVFILVLLMTFYYSRMIAKPLLQVNRITKKMADLDFSEKVPVRSSDEIGSLSDSINQLSVGLKTHIEQMEIANEQLQQDVEKERKLEKTRKEFISGVSHELKTPLSIIQTCISVLKDGVARHKADHYFDAVEREVRHMDRLIVDMLELAKMESGTYKWETESFSICDLVEQVCSKLRPGIDKKNLLLVWEPSEEMEVTANPNLIEQVLVNLINNAIRYTPPGESIHVSIRQMGSHCQVSVENSGVHIADEALHRLWDRFYRVDTSRNRSAGGTGLGLSIVKRILELHEAEHGAKNTPDGVMFYFSLPLSKATK